MQIRRALVTAIALVALLLCGLAMHLPGGAHAMAAGTTQPAHAAAAAAAHGAAAHDAAAHGSASGPLVASQPETAEAPVGHAPQLHPETAAMVCLLVLLLTPVPLARRLPGAIGLSPLVAPAWRMVPVGALPVPRTPAPLERSISRT